MAALVISLPNGKTKTVALTRKVMIGRSSSCGLQLKFDGVSRNHAQLLPSGDTWTIRDVGSRHGTRVNGMELVDVARLDTGDVVKIGEIEAIFHARHPLDSASSRVEILKPASDMTIRMSVGRQESGEFLPAINLADTVQLARDYEKLRLAQLLATRLATGARLDSILGLVLEFCESTLTVQQGVVLFRSDPEDPFKPRAAMGGENDEPVQVSESVLTMVSQMSTGLLIEDAVREPALMNAKSIVFSGTRSILAVPLVVEEAVTGMIYLQNRAAHAFDKADLVLLMGIAEQASAALQRDVLVRRVERSRELRASLGRFLPPAVANAVERGKLSLERGGEIATIAMLFSDIRGFTTLSENLGPTESMSLLNRYFEEMVESVFHHSGTLDKYMGDGLVAMWGAPTRESRSSELALRCALDMLERLDRFNREREADGHEPISIGIGIHTGPALVGLLGSDRRLEYTAIGDVVNTTSRLCGIAGPSEVVVSIESVMNSPGLFITDNEREVVLKGKRDPMSVCTLKGLAPGK